MKKYLLLALFTLAIISCEEEIPVYTVTVSSSPSEGGSVSPQGGEYEQGQTASFTATPNEYYRFAGWSGAGTSTTNPISIIVDTNKSLTARFEKLDKDNDGITDDIDQCPDTPANEQADSNGCSVSQKDFELTVSVEGEGTVTEVVVVAPTMYQGTTQVQLTAVPAEGWEFTEWTGNATGTDNPITIEIDGTKNITAVFTKKDTDGDGVPDLDDSCADTPEGEESDENGCSLSQKEFELTVTTEGEGTVTEELIIPPTIYQGTTQVQLTAVPAEGWELIEWTGDATGSENPITIEIDGAKSVTAVFAKKDTDSDGVPDIEDSCPDTPSDEEADENGCSISQRDSDNDGVNDQIDQCPDTPEGEEADENGCALSQKDSDVDGVTDDIDECPDTEEGVVVDENGCQANAIYVDDNGVTIKANEWAQVGNTYELNEASYLIVDEDLLRNIVNENKDLTKVVTTRVTDMSYLLRDRTLNEDIGSWDVSNVTNMEWIFRNTLFNEDISKWNVSKVTNMSGMFFGSPFNGDISDWDVSSVINMNQMFERSQFNRDISAWDVSSVEDMYEMFFKASFNGDISDWDVSSVTRMTGMFAESPFDNDISSWNVSSVYGMNYMFKQTEFNSDISSWDVSNVKGMNEMFSYSKFNSDISNWDVSSVTNMDFMFHASLFNQELSTWEVSNVETMEGMFSQSVFNNDISQWDTANVLNMAEMFRASEFNQNIANWNVSSVYFMNRMFNNSSFNQDISSWCVSYFTNEPDDFSTDSPLNENNSPIWGTCPPSASNINLNKYSESKSCINGVCDVNLGLRLSNNSEETISVTKIEKWVNDSLITTYTSGDMIGDLASGASKGFGITLNSASTGQIKVFWSYGDKSYAVIYDWTY